MVFAKGQINNLKVINKLFAMPKLIKFGEN